MWTQLVLLSLAATPDGGTFALELGVDLHAHVSMEDAAKPIFKGRSGKGRLADSPSVVISNQLEAKGMIDSGVRLIVGSVWPPNAFRPGRSDTDEALHQLKQLREFPKRAEGFQLAMDAAQARKILKGGLIAVVPGVEGGEGIHRVEDVDRLFAAGMRVLTLVHFGDNDLGTAVQDQLTGAIGMKQGPDPATGLTPLGRDAVKRMIQLGVVIDVAHASDPTVRDVLDITEPLGVPIINTHTGARALTPAIRNISDELAARIVKGGGIIGVTSFDRMVKGAPAAFNNAVPGTCDDIVAHWLHFAKLVGPESLVFGSDFNGFVTRPKAGGSCPQGLRHSGDYSVWAQAVREAGIPEKALHGMGERFLQVIEKVEAKADPAARAKAAKMSARDKSFFDVAL